MAKMKRFEQGYGIVLLATVVVLVISPAIVLAMDTWCYTNHPDAVFCDDFDRYCTEQPTNPNERCVPPDGCTKANWLAHEIWVPIPCGAIINLQEGAECGGGEVTSQPYGAKYPKGDQGQHNVNLAAYANAKYGGSINSVKGTDANPLVLEFIINGQTAGKLTHANTFIELALMDGVNFIDHRAPTDYVFSSRCVYEPYGIDINQPMICQQDVPPVGCPNIANAPHVGSIAVGALAYLDKTPCEAPTYLPTNEHLAVFDGYKWWTLPASFQGQGNFVIGDGENYVRLTLTSTMMAVELSSQGQYSWCDVPRDYQGAFNKMSLGFGNACLIDLGSWTCAKTPGTDRVYTCIPTVSTSKNHYAAVGPIYDSVALYGGEGHELPMPIGACCLTNGNCLDSLNQYQCETLNGGIWEGMATACATTTCCPDPFADADGDGDVDQKDFGIFQSCFTGPGPVSPVPTGQCTCFDRSFWATGDADVDDLDFADFDACWSGPTIPADPACDDSLHM